VLEGALADACQVADSFGALHWVDARAAGLHRSALRSIDATRPVVELRFDGVEAQPLPGAGKATLARLRDAAYVILAADTLGAGWTPAPSRAPPQRFGQRNADHRVARQPRRLLFDTAGLAQRNRRQHRSADPGERCRGPHYRRAMTGPKRKVLVRSDDLHAPQPAYIGVI
jgi:hypothetical protein